MTQLWINSGPTPDPLEFQQATPDHCTNVKPSSTSKVKSKLQNTWITWKYSYDPLLTHDLIVQSYIGDWGMCSV